MPSTLMTRCGVSATWSATAFARNDTVTDRLSGVESWQLWVRGVPAQSPPHSLRSPVVAVGVSVGDAPGLNSSVQGPADVHRDSVPGKTPLASTNPAPVPEKV